MNNIDKPKILLHLFEYLNAKEVEYLDLFKSYAILVSKDSQAASNIAERRLQTLALKIEQQGERLINFAKEIRDL